MSLTFETNALERPDAAISERSVGYSNCGVQWQARTMSPGENGRDALTGWFRRCVQISDRYAVKSSPAHRSAHANPPHTVIHTGSPGRPWLEKPGPGIITGAADDDPSGIATYSQAGAAFGFNILWTVLLTYPLMVAIHIISARIGRGSGHGLATNIRRHYPVSLLYSAVILLLVANTINIAADLTAMGAAVNLVVGGPTRLYTVGLAVSSLVLQVFVPYKSYVRVLKWLTLALLAYVAVVFAVKIPWMTVAARTVVPHPSWSNAYLTTVVAVFGTTISPYLFFWQASEEVEDLRAAAGQHAPKKAPWQAVANLRRIGSDTRIGMAFSNLIAFFIVLTAAATLHAHKVIDIQTSSQAASALNEHDR